MRWSQGLWELRGEPGLGRRRRGIAVRSGKGGGARLLGWCLNDSSMRLVLRFGRQLYEKGERSDLDPWLWACSAARVGAGGGRGYIHLHLQRRGPARERPGPKWGRKLHVRRRRPADHEEHSGGADDLRARSARRGDRRVLRDDGSAVAEYVYVDGQRLCKITHDAQGVERRVYYHQDVVGTPVAETNESGQVLVRANYTPFGEEVIPGAATDPHKFTGKELDDESGLYYFGARYYDAHLGRFVSTDSTAGSNFDPQSWNRYAYSRNNPLNRIDPNGKAWIQVNVTGVDAMRNMIQQTLAPVLGSKVSTALASALVPAQFDPAMCALGMASPLAVTTPALSRGAQILANAAKGKAAEAIAAEQLVTEGNTILGSQVSANTSLGRRVIDHLIQTPEGRIMAVEVKSGGGTRTAAQLARDTEMAITGATLVGKNAPDQLQGVQVIETVVMRIIF